MSEYVAVTARREKTLRGSNVALRAAGAIGLCLLATLFLMSPAHGARPEASTWVTGWTVSQHATGQTKLTNASVRLIARTAIPGDAVRVRLDNTFGTTPITFAAASISLRLSGAAVAKSPIKPLTFEGKRVVTIPAGGTARSDTVALNFGAQQDLAISLFVVGSDIQPSQHTNAFVTSYVTENGAGDQTASFDGKAFNLRTTSMLWLKSLDVHTSWHVSAIVAFGDSITDGACSTLDAHDRWEDVLSQRFLQQTPIRFAVLNEGIGGNTLRSDYKGIDTPPALDRLERDVLSHSGVSHVILFMGSNDINRGASADQVIRSMQEIIGRVHAKGIKIIGTTMIPRHAFTAGAGRNRDKLENQIMVNAWMRGKSGFDGIIDFHQMLARRDNVNLIEPIFDCGDGTHPSRAGHYLMGSSIDLAVFESR